MPLSKVQAGQRISRDADTHNAFVDAANFAKQNTQRTTPRVPIREINSAVVLVYNGGGNLDQFAAVGLNDPVILPADNETEFKGKLALKVGTPSTGDEGYWGVLLEAIPANEYGHAVVAGVTQCKIDIKETTHTECEIESGKTIPKSVEAGTGSAIIVWVKGGAGGATATGEQWAIIKLLGPVPTTKPGLAKITGSLGKTGAYTGYEWTPKAAGSGDIVVASGTLAESDFGSQGPACILLNSQEVGGSGHDLVASGVLPLLWLVRFLYKQADGKNVYAIEGLQNDSCQSLTA